MIDRAICPDCDRAVAIDADLNCADCTDDADCKSCSAMCWRNFHPACQNPAVDWKQRAERAEDRVKDLEELLSRIVYDEPSTMLATYSGGYRDIEQLTVFEHGMETAIEHIRQVARAVLDGGKT